MNNEDLLQLPHETRDELQAIVRHIEAWEKEQNDIWFWEKLGRLPFKLLDKLTPRFIHEKIGLILGELGSYIQTGGRYLISEKQVMSRLTAYLNKEFIIEAGQDPLTIERVRHLPLRVMDRTAEEMAQTSIKLATVQGATTGFGGLFTLAIDIPAVLGLSLKVIQELAICYGFDPKDKQERVFAIKCLQFASSDIVGKKAILDEIAVYDSSIGSNQAISQLQGWREVVMTYRDNFGWKKLFQLVPVAGMVFGAWINRGTLQDVAEAGLMLYRKRRAVERLRQ
jgi:hypothetical protein